MIDVNVITAPMTVEDFEEREQLEATIHEIWMGPEWQPDDFRLGKCLSTIYNKALFRATEPYTHKKGNRATWLNYCANTLSEVAPGSGTSKNWADYRRFFYEVKTLLEKSSSKAVAKHPINSVSSAKELRGFIPRRWAPGIGYGHGNWMPADLENGDYNPLVKVWERACENAELMQLDEGPRVADVIAAREELKHVLDSRARFFNKKKPTGRPRAVAA